MEKPMETPNNLLNELLVFLEKFLNLFIVEGISIEIQQLVKVSILIILLLFLAILASVLISIISKLLKPTIESMQGHPEYIFLTILSILVFSFTDDISFGNILAAIFILSLVALAYQYLKQNPNTEKLEEKKPNL
jgi:hypothetical protein